MKTIWEEGDEEDFLDIYLTESEIALIPKRTVIKSFFKEGKMLERRRPLNIALYMDNKLIMD